MPHSTSCKNAKIFISPSHPKTCANDLPCETRDQKCTSSQNLIQSGVESEWRRNWMAFFVHFGAGRPPPPQDLLSLGR